MTTSAAEPDHDNTPPAGALTTVFTMPAICSTMKSKYDDFDCMPPAFSKSYWYGYAGYYSPAICPGNYTSACERPKSASGGTPFGPPMAEGENAIICCPTGYECLTGSESWCISTQPTTSVYTYAYDESYSDIPRTTSRTTQVWVPSGYAIQVRWREQDRASLATDPLTPGASATPPPASTSHPTAILSSALSAATISSANNTTNGGGMSTSSKVGVGVGVPLGILAIAGLLFTFCFLRRRRRHPSLDRSGSDAGKDLPEVHYTSLPHNKGGPMVGVNTVSSPSMAGSGAGVYNSYNNNYNHPEHHASTNASGSIVMSPSSTMIGGGGPRASSFSSPAPAAAQYSPAPMAQPEYIPPPKPSGGSVPMMMMNHAYNNNSTSHLSSPSITSPPAAIVGGSGGSSSGAAFAPAPASSSSPPHPLAMFASLSSLHSHDYSNDSRSIHEAPGSNGWQQGSGGGGLGSGGHNSFHHDYLPGVPPSLDGAGHLDVPGISSVRSDDDDGDSATIATPPPPSYPPAAGAAFAPRGGFGGVGGSGSSEAGERVSSEHGGGGGGGSSSSNSGKGLAPPHGDDTDEIVRLRREAQRLQERRQRLTEMQQLDEEEERVMGRLRELEGRRVVY